MYILLLNTDTLFYEESQVNVCIYFQLFFNLLFRFLIWVGFILKVM
jgi:hypothetical protein